jgi:hypothetical protein
VRDFARRAGIPPSSLQHILDGGKPNVAKLVSIARAGGVSVDWLATGEGPRDRAPPGLAEPAAPFAAAVGANPCESALLFDDLLMAEMIEATIELWPRFRDTPPSAAQVAAMAVRLYRRAAVRGRIAIGEIIAAMMEP